MWRNANYSETTADGVNTVNMGVINAGLGGTSLRGGGWKGSAGGSQDIHKSGVALFGARPELL